MTQESESGARPVQRPGPGSRPRSYKTEAIVLRSRPAREADRLITVLTPSMGKLLVTVRGARRINSRLGGHLDVFNRVSLTLALGHHIDVVTGAESMETFAGLKADLDRLAQGLYLMELADALLPDASPHPAAYVLLMDALRALDGDAPVGALPRYVELRMLEDSGYLPELHRCLVCGKEIEAGHHRFAPGLGGVVCDTCAVPVGQVLALSVDALKVLRHFARSRFDDGGRLSMAAAVHDQLERALGASLRYVLEREMATAEFVEHLRRLRRRTAPSAAAPQAP
jgi:DNA repair protein RecO (recombination protein O)